MATVREYFDLDVKAMSAHADWEIWNNTGAALPLIRARVSQDYNANAKYMSFLIPEGADIENYAAAIFTSKATGCCSLSQEGGDAFYVEEGFADYSERATSATLVFTRRLFLYFESLLAPQIRRRITDLGARSGFHVLVRDEEYAMKRSQYEKPLAFISHDTRDKDSLVRELALGLLKYNCPVWYDEYSLKVGDSLRATIEKGLKETRKCIIVLSPNFLSNDGWGKAEFDSIFTREILEKNNVMLPVWHNVGVREVYDYSPRLADKVGLSSTLGVDQLAQKLAQAVNQGSA
jgi:hypothetical protein